MNSFFPRVFKVLCCALERLGVIFLFPFMIWIIDCLSLDSFESSTRLVGGGWSGLSNVYVGSGCFYLLVQWCWVCYR